MFSVDADFPGGNVIVDRIEGDTVYLRQDLRDTDGWWFYWCFRVRGAEGRTLTFHFIDGNVIGTRGPAVSTDGGVIWSWLGDDGGLASGGVEFSYAFPLGVDEVRFCFAIPYLQSHLDAFLAQYDDRQDVVLQRSVLCRTRKGRNVEALRLGCLHREPDHRVLLTSRHHACESIATYSLEGLMAEVLSENEAGTWLREHVEFFVVPFVDKDGVEDGDQGKNRRPYDHNRDYGGRANGDDDSIYASTQALRERIPAWSGGKLRVALDMHCPWIRGEHNEVIYFVGGRDQENWARVGAFSRILEDVQTGRLVYCADDNLPFGEAWNTADNTVQGRSFSRWASALPGIWMGTSVEISYANVRDMIVTADGARAFGHDLARALCEFLQNYEDV